MSKLYGIVQGCNNGEATRRGHKRIDAVIKNWSWKVESELIDKGGGDCDFLRVTLRNIDTGKSITLAEGTIGDIVAADPLKGLLDIALANEAAA